MNVRWPANPVRETYNLIESCYVSGSGVEATYRVVATASHADALRLMRRLNHLATITEGRIRKGYMVG